jgi:stage III sporulation protein SpoIIIAA
MTFGCNRSLEIHIARKIHLKNVLPRDPAPSTCTIYGKEGKNRRGYIDHMRNHHRMVMTHQRLIKNPTVQLDPNNPDRYCAA